MNAIRPARAGLLRGLALAAGGLLLAVVLLALGGVAMYDREQQIAQVRERSELMARVFADGLTRNVESTALATATLAELLARGLAPESIEMRTAVTQTLVNLSFLRGIAILDAQGQVLASADATEIGRVIDLTPFGPVPAAGRDLLGPYVPARRLLELSRGGTRGAPAPAGVGFLPLLRTAKVGSRQWLLVAMINPAAFTNFQQVTLNDEQAAAAIVTYGGRLVASTATGDDGSGRPVGADLTALPAFTAFLPRIESGSWIGDGLRPGRQIAAFRTSASRPLLVTVEYSFDATMAAWLRRSHGLLLAALAATLLIGAMTVIAARSLRARELARAALDRAQRDTAERERELNVTVQSLQELIFRTDETGVVTYVNPRWRAVTDADIGATGGVHLWDLVIPAERRAVRALFTPQGGPGARQVQAQLRDREGLLRTFDIAAMPLLLGDTVTGYAGSANDVSALTETQRRLAAQLRLTEQLMEVSPLPSSVTDTARRYILVNHAWELFTGRRRDEVIGQVAGAHLTPEQDAASRAGDREVLASAAPTRYEDRYPHCDGSLRDVIINKIPLRDPDGGAHGILSVVIDVTEFRNAERAIREARDTAEDASRAKSEFIANISHELRTPLQSIIGFSELGQVRGREQPRLAGMFDDINRAGQRMLALVNDLLDVAKIESTVGTIHLERADLRLLVREVLHELEPLLAQRQQQVDLDLPAEPMRGKVDPQRFQQVLRNVLANAIKFSPVGGSIGLRGEVTDDEQLHLAISDAGPGIPPAELDSIFEAFVQSSQTKDGSGGTGLGLAICRKIIDAHGGQIRAENRLGGGAVFHITLPARGTMLTAPMPL